MDVTTVGDVLSIVPDRAAEFAPVLPAVSVAFALISKAPSPKVLSVILQSPEPSAVSVPRETVPLNSSTREPISAVPLIWSEAELVTLSIFEVPESKSGSRSGCDGASGAVLSIVPDRAAEFAPVLPAVSVAFALISKAPSPKVLSVILQSPEPSAVSVPRETVPLNSSTREPISAVPLIWSEAELVTLSIFEVPESKSGSRSGCDGASGGTVSIVTVRPPIVVAKLSAASVAFT